MSRVEDALLLRDLVQKIVNDKLGKDRPGSTYATVTGFNPALGTVTVIYDGDTIEVDIPAGSIYPSEIGQVVKIGGPSGSRVVEDVMGENLTAVQARTAQATADGKNTVNYGDVPPPGADHKDGDIWFDEANSNMPNIWDGVEWKSIEDLRVSAVQAAQDELRGDLDAVIENGTGTKNHYSTTMPIAAVSSEGDLWFDPSDNNKPYIYEGGAWITVQSSFAKVGAGEDIFTLTTPESTTKNALDNQWSNVAGFTGVPGANGVTATVPSGASGAATIRFPLTGSFDAAGAWTVPSSDFIKSSGLGVGMSGTIRIFSPGATPTARIVMKYDFNGTAQEVVINLIVQDDIFGSTRTHSVIMDAQDKTLLGLYPTIVPWSICLELSIGSTAGNNVSVATTFPYVIGGKAVADKAITTGKIAVGAITAESGVVGSLSAGDITVGTLDVARLAANSITTDKVLLTSGSELAADPWFDGQETVWLPPSSGAGSGFTTEVAMDGHKSSTKMMPYTSGSSALYAAYLNPGSRPSSQRIPCQPGDKFEIYAWVRRSSGAIANLSTVDCRVYAYTSPYDSGAAGNANGRAGDNVPASSFPVDGWVKVGGAYTVPAGRYSFSPRLTVYTSGTWAASGSATWYVGGYSVRAMVGSTLIEPGAITTEKLAVGAITAESGVIGSLDASKITVGTLSGARLAADAINGKQIVGATITTSLTFPRVQLDSAGLSVYKSSSVRSFFADAATGDLSIVGDFGTAADGNERVFLTNALWNSIAVTDEDGATVGTAPGAGLRVGKDVNSAIEMFHAKANHGVGDSTDFGKIRGPRGHSTIEMRSRYKSSTSQYFASITSLVATAPGSGVKVTHSTSQHWVNWTSDVTPASGFYKPDAGINLFGASGGGAGVINMYASSNKRVASSGYASGAHILIDGAPNSTTAGRITMTTYLNASATTSASLDLFGSFSGYANSFVQLKANNGSVYTDGSDIRPLQVTYTGTASSWLIPFIKGSTEWGYIGSTGAMNADDFGIQSGSGKRLFLSASGSSTNMTMESAGDMLLNVTTSNGARIRAKALWDVTSTTGASVRVNSAGTLFSDSSSRRYKQDIADARDLTGILDIQPRIWRERAAVQASEDLSSYREEVGIGPVPMMLADATEDVPWQFGAVAEEVHDLGLTEFVQYDPFGRPNSLDYDRMGVALVPIIRDLRERIIELESKLDTPN